MRTECACLCVPAGHDHAICGHTAQPGTFIRLAGALEFPACAACAEALAGSAAAANSEPGVVPVAVPGPVTAVGSVPVARSAVAAEASAAEGRLGAARVAEPALSAAAGAGVGAVG
jgi:hypothetical protein